MFVFSSLRFSSFCLFQPTASGCSNFRPLVAATPSLLGKIDVLKDNQSQVKAYPWLLQVLALTLSFCVLQLRSFSLLPVLSLLAQRPPFWLLKILSLCCCSSQLPLFWICPDASMAYPC
jgi:hypothetical protein